MIQMVMMNMIKMVDNNLENKGTDKSKSVMHS